MIQTILSGLAHAAWLRGYDWADIYILSVELLPFYNELDKETKQYYTQILHRAKDVYAFSLPHDTHVAIVELLSKG
jgi:hypothetical protein